jgi:hypothetical protein
MGSIRRQGWFRRPSGVLQPARRPYPRIVPPEPEASPAPPTLDLFMFEASSSFDAGRLEIQEVVPVAPVSPEDVLRLAGQAGWPEGHPISLALGAALLERGGPDARPERAGIWHLSAGRGIQGYLNGFHVLIGNEQLMRDGGIPLTETVRRIIAGHALRGWHSVLIGARAAAVDREDVHRSLIGVLAFAPQGRMQASSATAPASPTGGVGAFLKDRLGRLPWRTAVLLALASGLVSLYQSALTVEPDQVAVVRRFGRVAALCEPGLHFRWLWPVERVTWIRRGESCLLPLPNGHVEYQIADAGAYASAGEDPEGLLARIAERALLETFAGQVGARSAGSQEWGKLADSWRCRLQEQVSAAGLGIRVIDVAPATLEVPPGEAPPPPPAVAVEEGDLFQTAQASEQTPAEAPAVTTQPVAEAPHEQEAALVLKAVNEFLGLLYRQPSTQPCPAE